MQADTEGSGFRVPLAIRGAVEQEIQRHLEKEFG